jgi:hypothetical protein
LLIWLKLIFSDSEVAGNNAIGHVTSDNRKKPFQLARGAITQNSTCTQLSQYRRRAAEGESGGENSAIRTGIANAAQHLFHCGNAGFRRSARMRVPPSLFASPVPGFGISAIDAVAVVFAFLHGALLD